MRHRTIKGARLTLRPIEGRDAEAMFDLTSDVEGMRRIGINYTLTRDQVEQWAATVADATGRIDLAIVTDDDEYLGEAVLYDIDGTERSARLRVALRPGYRDAGFEVEAGRLVLNEAFGPLGLHRVIFETLSINPDGAALAEELGFSVDGRLRDSHLDGETWTDLIVYSLLEHEHQGSSRAAESSS